MTAYSLSLAWVWYFVIGMRLYVCGVVCIDLSTILFCPWGDSLYDDCLLAYRVQSYYFLCLSILLRKMFVLHAATSFHKNGVLITQADSSFSSVEYLYIHLFRWNTRAFHPKFGHPLSLVTTLYLQFIISM